MSPVDAISPPQKKKKAPLPKKNQYTRKEKKSTSKQSLDQGVRKKLLWIFVGVTAFLIFVAWIFLWQGGQLTNNSQSSDFLSSVSQKLTNLWQTIKTDILKLEGTLSNNNINVEEKKIKELEEQVFPQFTDPTKQ